MCMWKGGRRILPQVQPPLARWATNWTIQFPDPHEKKRALPSPYTREDMVVVVVDGGGCGGEGINRAIKTVRFS